MLRLNYRVLFVNAFCAVFAVCGLQTHAGTRVLLTSGAPLPSLGGDTLAVFGAPSLNNLGRVAFGADESIFSPQVGGVYRMNALGGGVTAIARDGQAAPDGDGVLDFQFGAANAFIYAINDSGQVHFSGPLRETLSESPETALFVGDGVTLQQRAREGQALPGGSVFTHLGGATFNHAGQLAFDALITPDNNVLYSDRAIYRSEANGALTRIVRGGDDASRDYAEANGLQSSTQSPHSPTMNDSGQVAYSAAVYFRSQPFAFPAPFRAVYLKNGGGPSLTELAYSADVVLPSTAFTPANLGRLNNAGQTTVRGGITTAPTPPFDDAVIRSSAGSRSLVARTNVPPPGQPDEVFVSVNTGAINNAGQIAFYGSTETNVAGGLYFFDGGLRKIAASGDAFGPDTTFGGINSSPHGINDAGQVLFGASLSSPTSGQFGDPGLFRYDPDDNTVATVALVGDPLLGSTITVLQVASDVGQAFHDTATSFNDEGAVAYAFRLANGVQGLAYWDERFTFDVNGDYNGSGQVEQGDLDLVLQNWGVDVDAAGIPSGWINGLPSGQIEQTELDGVLQSWGSTSAPDLRGGAVPEPAAVTSVGLLAVFAGRRRA